MAVNNKRYGDLLSSHIALGKQGVSDDLAHTLYAIRYGLVFGHNYEEYLTVTDTPVSKNIYNYFKTRHLIGV